LYKQKRVLTLKLDVGAGLMLKVGGRKGAGFIDQ